MRKRTVLVVVLTIFSLLLSPQLVGAKSAPTEKKQARSTENVSKAPSPKSQSASAKKSSKEEKRPAASKDDARQAKASGKPPRGRKESARREAPAREARGKEAPARERALKEERGNKGRKRTMQAEPAPAKPALPDSFRGEFGVATKAALVQDMETGRVLFAQEPDMPIPPASLTKVLTLYLVNELLRDGSLKLEQPIPVSEAASHAGGSTMRLKTGEMVPLDDLVKGIAIVSANDGCVAVAEYLGKGEITPFVEAMNRKAKELGMTNSQFFNPNGLPHDEQLTTARDMATLASAYLKRFPESLSIHSMTEFTRNNRVRHNSNTLLGRVEGVDGLKTGFVCASGYNIVVTAKRGDTRLVAVVLGAKNRRVREREATRLLEEGFKIVAAEKAASGKQVAQAH